MDNSKRMLVAILLSTVILVGFMFYQSKTAPPRPAGNNQSNSEIITTESGMAVNTSTLQNIKPITVAQTNEAELVEFENESVIAVFSNGALHSYKLKKFFNGTVNDGTYDDSVNMVEQVYEGAYPFTLTFQTLSNSIAKRDNIYYYIESKSSNSVTFASDVSYNEKPIKLKKMFTITGKPYEILSSVSIENVSDTDISLYYSYILATGLGPYRAAADTIREDITKAGYLREGKNTISFLLDGSGKKDVKMSYKSYNEAMQWASINNRYFALISSVPYDNTLFESAIFSKPITNEFKNNFQFASFSQGHNIQSGSTIVDSYTMYMGPKSRAVFAADYKDVSYQSIFKESFIGINLRPLTYILDVILNKLYQFTKSYAWSIILFTFLFKVVTFPLTQASYKSMKKMQLLNPKIEKIREQYKNSPEKMNTEVMNIYKKEKINPLGGCLPMLLPFPLLIAFFYLMQSMVELRNAHFLWITDLSSPDKLFIFSEALPFIGGMNFNLLPIIMAITSYLSMKLQPTSASGAAGNQMKMMSTIFPLMMLFMFYNFASGLALYWTAQNVFGVLQQVITSYISKMKGDDMILQVQVDDKKKKKKKH